MNNEQRTTNLDFYTYPSVGTDDWCYAFETARVRALELQMFTRAAFLYMANAENFEQAADLLSGTEYALPGPGEDFVQLESILLLRRTAARKIFSDLMRQKSIAELFKTRDDFANLRLALRRTLTEKPLLNDYSDEGNVSLDLFEQAFTEDNYELLPTYMQQAVEQAILAYYQNKDIRQIDFVIDSFQAEYNLKEARRLKSVFLIGLFGIQNDLTNIRTMLRLKFTESHSNVRPEQVFLKGGFVEPELFEQALELGYESLAPLFFATPYYRIVEAGASYLASEKSFLRAEQQCDEHLTGFLKSTLQITAGPQPIVAFLLMKENEIRNVRLVLTAKKNNLDTKLIQDRIG